VGNTLNERFVEIVDRRRESTAFMVKRRGSWESFSFEWAMQQVRRVLGGRVHADGEDDQADSGFQQQEQGRGHLVDLDIRIAACTR